MVRPDVLAIIIFLCVYTFLALSTKHRAIAVWIGGILFFIFKIITPQYGFLFINWNVIGIFCGTLLVSELFIHSKVPAYLADLLVNRSNSVGVAMLLVCILSGFISMFVENVATVLIVAPVALEIAKKIRTSPVPFIIGIAVSSNLQGTATLIGDPPSMILAGFLKMRFNDFFFLLGRPSIFFSVEIGAVASFVVLYLIFKKYRQRVRKVEKTKIESWTPSWLLIGMIVLLALSSFVDVEFSYLAGIICMIFGVIGLLWQGRRDKAVAIGLLKNFDWETTFFLMGIFVMVAGLKNSGCIDEIASFIKKAGVSNTFIVYTILVWFSVFVSAFVDNVPYVTAMIPVGQTLANGFDIPPFLFLFGILIGACLGGNITPIGASANIVGVGLLKKKGYECSFWDFMRIGLPFTIFAVIAAYIFTWIIW